MVQVLPDLRRPGRRRKRLGEVEDRHVEGDALRGAPERGLDGRVADLLRENASPKISQWFPICVRFWKTRPRLYRNQIFRLKTHFATGSGSKLYKCEHLSKFNTLPRCPETNDVGNISTTFSQRCMQTPPKCCLELAFELRNCVDPPQKPQKRNR